MAVRSTISMPSLGMSRRFASDLTELLEVIHAQLVAEKVEENVLQSATVGDSQNKAKMSAPIL